MRKSKMILLFVFCSIQAAFSQQVLLDKSNYIEINAAKAAVSLNEKMLVDEKLSAYDLYEFDLSALNELVRKNANQANLKFNLPGKKSIEISIHEHEIRSLNYRAVAKTKDGLVDLPRYECQTYKGYTDAGENVRLTITDSYIYGFVEIEKELLFFHSLAKFVPGVSTDFIVVYRSWDCVSEVECSEHRDSPAPMKTLEEGVEKTENNGCHFVKFATDCDFEQYEASGSNEDMANAIALGEMNVAEGFYSDEIGLQFEIVFQIVRMDEDDSYEATATNNDQPEKEMRDNWSTLALSTVVRDYVLMFSGRSFSNGGVNGSVFTIGAMCDIPTECFGFVSLKDFSNSTTTHEIGHTIDGVHDACDQDIASIMCSSQVNRKFELTEGNRTMMTNHLKFTTCLNNGNVNNTFESGLASWKQATNDNFDWSLSSGSTPTTETGPAGPYQGSSYLFAEASGNENSKAQIISEEYYVCDNGLYLSFGYHMYGSAIGKLEVEISTDKGVNWEKIWLRSGDHGDVWLTGVYSLHAFEDEVIVLRFTAQTGSGDTGDIAIDDLAIGSNCQIDASAKQIEFPQSGGTKTFTVWGSGSWEAHRPGFGDWTTLSTFGNIVTVTAEPNAGGGRMVPVYVSCGPNVVTVTVVQAGIQYTPVDFICQNDANMPHAEGFEGETYRWVQDSNDDFDWTQWSGPTPSSGTGPNSGAAEGIRYMYTEADGNFNKVANLISPCFNLENFPNPTLSFSYHMWASFSNHMGVLNLQVSYNNGFSWHTLWSETGGHGGAWHPVSIDLSDYTSLPIRLRFNGTTGNGFKSDMAIDDIRLNAGGCDDAYEGNNTFADAHSSTMGTSIDFPNACLYEGDEDYFQLFFNNGFNSSNCFVRVKGAALNTNGDYGLKISTKKSSLIIETYSVNNSNTDTYLYVYNDAESGYVAQDDNSGSGNFSKITVPISYLTGPFARLQNPEEFELSNFPNPFNQTTTFTFSLMEDNKVSLNIMDLTGKVVATPIRNTEYAKGNHQLVFDARNLPAGVYRYTLETSKGLNSKQMVIMK